jgi:5-methylcytosine-specific restriction endonuclease McrA
MKKKKDIRKNFRNEVFKRDNYTCQVCGIRYTTNPDWFDAHHIIDRSEIPNGGYVKENGITVCKDSCHMRCEKYHISGGNEWEEGLHPDDLYKIIKSSKELAIEKSKLL